MAWYGSQFEREKWDGAPYDGPAPPANYYGQQPQQGSAQQPLLKQNTGVGFIPGDRGKNDAAPPEVSLEQLMQISFVAWVIFAVICLLFGLSYHDSYTEIWVLICLGVCVLTMIIYQSMKNYNADSVHKVSVIVATWLLVAVVAGAWVGLFSYDCCIGEYWDKQQLESRENVLPAESAAAYKNAGQVIFADEARVDPSRSVGYKDGKVYCVAPVASDFDFETTQFWAAGIDCCGARGTFVCDDAWNPKAHAGVVIRNGTWSMMNENILDQYQKAVKLAEVTYGIASAKEPIFVRWVSNPSQVELNIWRAGMGVLLAAIIISSLICGLQACAIHFCLNGGNSRGSYYGANTSNFQPINGPGNPNYDGSRQYA